MNNDLVLASASPRRIELLRRAGYDPEVRPYDVNESVEEEMKAEDFFARDAAETIARRKIRAALADIANAGKFIIAADTVVEAADGELLGKPKDRADARRMLHKLSGTCHHVHTGVAVAHADNPYREGIMSVAVTSTITFRPLTDAEIDAYVDSGESDGKAGAYAIQEHGDKFVTSIEGEWDNIVGLPVKTVAELLQRQGYTKQ